MGDDWQTYMAGLRSLDKYQAMAEAVREGREYDVGGLFGSSAALLLATLRNEVKGVYCLAASGLKSARTLRDDFLHFFDREEVVLFPPWAGTREGEPETDEDRETFARRLGVLCRFVEGSPPAVVVAPVQALAQDVVPPAAVKKNTRWIRVGESLDLPTFLPWLECRDLRRVPMAESNGEWSLRGSILDIFPYSSPEPFRIELFDETVDSIRRYDPATQVSVRRLDRCRITLIQKRRFKKPGGRGAASLLDYLPPGSLFAAHEPERILARVNERFQRTGEPRTALAWDRFLRDARRFPVLSLTSMPHEPDRPGVDFVIRSVHRANPGIEGVLEGFRELTKKKTSGSSVARKAKGRG
jgi:transcription-repair coupling factor (superfamily II helicase)